MTHKASEVTMKEAANLLLIQLIPKSTASEENNEREQGEIVDG